MIVRERHLPAVAGGALAKSRVLATAVGMATTAAAPRTRTAQGSRFDLIIVPPVLLAGRNRTSRTQRESSQGVYVLATPLDCRARSARASLGPSGG